jgi:type IV pilus assembly protein PilM
MPCVGLDFSDATMRFIELEEERRGILPKRFAQMEIPSGLLQGGRIVDANAFTTFLKQVREKYKLKYLRVSIPESQVYSFTLSLDTAASENIQSAIELVLEDNIPLKTAETIFDYHILSHSEKNIVVQVVAVSEATTRAYFECFTKADLMPLSFELDGQAIARAVLPQGDNGSYMIVDFGANRTSMTITTNGTAVYTSTLDFGGKMLINALSKELNISIEEAEKLKETYGLSTAAGDHKNIFSIMSSGIATLRDEINRRYVYWHERKDQYGSFPGIETVYLCGGHGNLKGLDDYLSVSLKLKVIKANPWVNCLSLDTVIPKMPYEYSMSYVTAIGLALSDYTYD